MFSSFIGTRLVHLGRQPSVAKLRVYQPTTAQMHLPTAGELIILSIEPRILPGIDLGKILMNATLGGSLLPGGSGNNSYR